jgi:single stranded DNA-binding protein
MSEVNITVVGNVATDPRLDKTKNDETFASFRLASNSARYDSRSRSWVDDDTSFYTVYCWRSPLADNITASLRKGDPVVVYGRLKNREWRDKNDAPRVSPEITARSLGHDLYRGTSTFTKVSRQPNVPDEDDAVDSVRAYYASGSDGLGASDQGAGAFGGLGNGRELAPAGAGEARVGGIVPAIEGRQGDDGATGLSSGTSGDGGMSGAGEPADPLADVTAGSRPSSRGRREKAGAPA